MDFPRALWRNQTGDRIRLGIHQENHYKGLPPLCNIIEPPREELHHFEETSQKHVSPT